MSLSLVSWASSHRTIIIRFFQCWYLLSIALLLFSFWVIAGDHPLTILVSKLGQRSGQLAVLFFILASLPGVGGRFRLRHPLLTLGLLFRRHLGISTVFFALLHSQINFFIPLLSAGVLPPFPPPLYISMGSIAFYGLLVLFFTSNDFSVRTLRHWWKRIHKLIYVLFWFIFLHLALQGKSLIALCIFVTAVLEIMSLVYDWMIKRQEKKAVLRPKEATGGLL